MNAEIRRYFIVAACLLIAVASVAHAEWQLDGTAICTASGDQSSPEVISDGAGGAIITWSDRRGGFYDIYAQRIDASGVVHWAGDGKAICTASGDQGNPQITTDGAGGAIITWADYRGYGTDIYAQRIDADGVVQWTANGEVICAADYDQGLPQITSDGAGGAIIAWQSSDDMFQTDIYAQRIDANGAVRWTAGGVAICTASDWQWNLQIASDGAGGAIVTWEDTRGDLEDIYAQRIDASGVVQWTADGVAICTASDSQRSPQITSDGAGGAIIVWHDERGADDAIYAQRIAANGVVQWTADGAAICTASGYRLNPQITSDEAGGAIVTWDDYRDGYPDIYAQRIDICGVVQWTTDGEAVCTASDEQLIPRITSDGAGGAIIAWRDHRPASGIDIYAQRINAGGTVQWLDDGVAICTASGNQQSPQITSDGVGGAILAWGDLRGSSYDVYAQLVLPWGRWGRLAPEIHAAGDAPGDEGGAIHLSWHASASDRPGITGNVTNYTIWRAIPMTAARTAADGTTDFPVAPLGADGVAHPIRVEILDSETRFWEHIDTQEAYFLEGYSRTVPTAFDSTSACSDYHYFQVIAHTSSPTVFYASEPDSGYSVDNLSPGIPDGIGGTYTFPNALVLTWKPNDEADLARYSIYQGEDEDFIPSDDNLVAAVVDTMIVIDPFVPAEGEYIKLSATDIHGNESGYSVLSPEDIMDVGPNGRSAGVVLYASAPNPMKSVTSIRFELPSTTPVRLAIYTVDGRHVRTLLDEQKRAGTYSAVWNGLDRAGRPVSSGVYLCRLDAGFVRRTQSIMLIR